MGQKTSGRTVSPTRISILFGLHRGKGPIRGDILRRDQLGQILRRGVVGTGRAVDALLAVWLGWVTGLLMRCWPCGLGGLLKKASQKNPSTAHADLGTLTQMFGFEFHAWLQVLSGSRIRPKASVRLLGMYVI